MNSLFKIIAENREVLKRPFKETAKKNSKKKSTGEKRRKTKRRVSYASQILAVLKNVHPSTEVSEPSMDLINSFVHDLFEKIAREAIKVPFYTKRSFITAREIQSAVQLVLPNDMGKHTVSEGNNAVLQYTNSK